MNKLECVLNSSEQCGGNIKVRTVFNDQLSSPICDNCFDQHEKIIYLNEQGMNINVLTRISDSNRDELYNVFKYVNSEEFKQKSNELSKYVEDTNGNVDLKKFDKMSDF